MTEKRMILNAKRYLLSAKKGFTLVEIMVVVGIIGLILSMAIPNFINARKKTRAKVCINNLHQIHGAKQQWALDTEAAGTETPASTVLAADYLESWPSCPAGGTYTMNNVSTVPTCDFDASADPAWGKHDF